MQLKEVVNMATNDNVPGGRAPLNRGRAWSANPQNLNPTVCNLFTAVSARLSS